MKRVLIELINNELSGGSSAEIGLKLSDTCRAVGVMYMHIGKA